MDKRPSFLRILWPVLLLAVTLTAGCASSRPSAAPEIPAASAATAASSPSVSAPEVPPLPNEPAAPAVQVLTPPEEEPTPLPPYDFSQPVPESEEVSNDYFADAAFVGDSRTDGLMIYSGVGKVDKFVSNGLSIFQLETKKALTIDGKKYTLLEALAQKQYGKVYLCLGINELGVNNAAGFYDSYCQAIEDIRAIQPNAVIYIQGLIPMNEEVIAQTIQRDYLKNERLRLHNDLMRQAAEEKQVAFLDLYSAFVDENGELPAQASRDGVHLLKEGYVQWLTYLKTHTVEYDVLYPNGTPAPSPHAPEGESEDGSVEA